MLGFGFGAGDRSFEDSDKENESPSSSPPWLKKQRVTQEGQESSHSTLVKTICDQLSQYRTGRALRTMTKLPNFDRDFNLFVREQCRLQSENILKVKDPPANEFSLESL